MKTDASHFDLQTFLRGLPLFSDLSALERERVATNCQIKRWNKGDLVFRVGEVCNAFHLVVTGQVKLFVLSASGQEKVIEIISAGQSFAEALVFLDKPYILSAQTLADTVLINVSKAGVISEIRQDPNFALHMLAGISKRLHGLIQDVESYALRSGMQRLIGYLLRDVETAPEASGEALTVSLPASKATIASRLSLTPEYFSRVLHELEDQQLIEIDRREIRIPDISKLAAYGSE